MDINQLNIEAGIFLRRLRMFSEQESIQINENTTELFVDIIRSVDKLMARGDMNPTSSDCLDFLFNLDGQQFDLRQYFMCRLCIVSSFFGFFLNRSFDQLRNMMQTNTTGTTGRYKR